MRRPVVAGVIVAGFVIIVVTFALIFASNGNQALPPTDTAVPGTEPPSVPVVLTVSPSPTVDQTALPITAQAYETAHADAMGDLTMVLQPGGMAPRVAFTEAQINELIAPYAPELGDVSNVVLDLQPGSASITADVGVLGITTVKVVTSGRVSLENNTFMLDITEASMGGIRPPDSAIDSVRREVVPLVYRAILDGLAEYAAPGEITLTSVEVTDTDLIIGFIFATPVPTMTPTPE